MRIIDLDFYADKGGAIFLGYAGEHLSTVLNFHMPAELGNNDCVYVVNFLKDGESSSNIVSHFAYKSRFNTNIVEYYIPSSIMGSGASSGVFHLVAYGMTTTVNNEVKYSLLGKSTEFHYVIDDAITTDTSDLNITLTDSESITMQNLIAAINQLGDIQAALGSLDTLVDTLENFIEATDVYEQKENNSDISINDILTSTLSEADKQKYLNLYRIKELARNLKASINDNTNNINSLSTKVGSDSFDDSTKIGDVIPVNIMDALKKISAALDSFKVIAEEVGDLKSTIDSIIRTGSITADSNGSHYLTWELKNGVNYKITNNSTGDINIRSETSDGTIVQQIGSVASNSSKTFTSTGNAQRILFYFYGTGSATIEDAETFSYETNEHLSELDSSTAYLRNAVDYVINEKTITTDASGSQYTDFAIITDSIYRITNNSNATVTVRTETEDGTIIQTVGNIEADSRKKFTATGNAQRILVYFRGAGSVKIEVTGTFAYETSEALEEKVDAVVDLVGNKPEVIKHGSYATINSVSGKTVSITFGSYGNAIGFKSEKLLTDVGKRLAIWLETDNEQSFKLGVQKNGSWLSPVSMQFIPGYGFYGVYDIPDTNNGYIYAIYTGGDTPVTVTTKLYAFDVTNNAELEAVIRQEGGFNLVGVHANSFDRFGKTFGKIINYFGDSNTANGRYQTFVNRQNGVINSYTSGVGGSNVAGSREDAFWQDARINTLHDDADIIYIMGGTNDSANSRNIGEATLANHTTTTFIGAYNVVISKIYYKYLNDTTGYYAGDGVDYSCVTRATDKKQILIVLGTPPFTSDSTYTNNGKMQEIIEAVKQVGNMWGLPVVNVWGDANLNAINYPDYYTDTVHVNVKGGQKIGNIIGKRINEVLR